MTTPISSTVTPLLKGTVTPQKITAQQLPQLWREFTADEKRLCQKDVALMMEAKLEPGVIVPVAAIEFFKIACASSNYKNDAVAKAIVKNGLGVCKFHGEVITADTLWKTETQDPKVGVGTGQGRSSTLNAGGIRVTTAHSWRCRFELPKTPAEIPSLEAYQTLAASIEKDHKDLTEAYAEVTRLVTLALATCEEGKALLGKIGGGWKAVADLKAEMDELQKALDGMKALGDKPYLKAAMKGTEAELASKQKEYEAAVKKAQEASAPAPLVAK